MKAQDLKNSILQMAMQGKLVPQNPNDKPASHLLKKIKKEKEQLIKEKKIKRNNKESTIFKENNHYYEKIGKKGEPVCIDDKIPFEIPESWEWTKIKNISEFVTKGTTPKGGKSAYKDDGIKFLRVENIGRNGELILDNIKYIDEDTHKNFLKRSILQENDLLISIAGALGRTGIVNKNVLPLNTNQAVSFVRWFNTSLIYIPFIEKAISSPPIQKLLLKQTKVTAIPNLTLEIIRECLIPLPPLDEQKRIVDKIEELLPFIDKYGEFKEELNKLNDDFPSKFKDSILQEAIQGKLVPQDINDEPASILLEKIKQEKEQLIKDKKIKRNNKESIIYKEDGHYYEKIGKGEPVCIDDELPFEIPDSWVWSRLNNIGEIVGGGTPKTNIDEYWENGDISWLTPADMKFVDGKYVSHGGRNITKLGLEKSSARLMPKNSIIYSSRAPIGYIGISKNELCTNQGFKSVVPFNKKTVEYMYYCLIALTKDIQSRASGTTFKEISGRKFGETLIPIPPLDEQKRIVDKVEDVLPLVDDLID